ncbi:MAG: hypothetical protein HRT88_17860, partial [Lentisphaeraceae bacterium]|nr:hypothetical protein [Lentisphaeraceae bacterium]
DRTSIDAMDTARRGGGLLQSQKFAQYKDQTRKGNQALFISTELSDIISALIAQKDKGAAVTLEKFKQMFLRGKKPGFFLLAEKLSNGYKLNLKSTFNLGSVQGSTLAMIGTVGVLAAMILPALGTARTKAKMANSKSKLKSFGQAYAIYFTDLVSNAVFPRDLTDLGLDPMMLTHPLTNKTATVAEFANGTADYLPMYKIRDKYEGSPDIIMIMERPGIWGAGKTVFAVFQDGHVESISEARAKKALELLKTSTSNK